MKIKKDDQKNKLFKIIAVVVLVGILLSFGAYYLGNALLSENKKFEEEMQRQAMMQMNEEKMKQVRESRIQVATVTGEIIGIEEETIILSGQIYDQEKKNVKIKLKEGGEIYRYKKTESEKQETSDQANYGVKEIIQFSDLKPGDSITSNLGELVSLADVGRFTIEVSEILVNQEIDGEEK